MATIIINYKTEVAAEKKEFFDRIGLLWMVRQVMCCWRTKEKVPLVAHDDC